MTSPEPQSDSSPSIELGEIWGRQRIIFLSVSAAVTVGVMWWASEVVLPFVLAVIIAYVLTPLVEYCERYRLPRSAAILAVYFVTLLGLYTSIALMAPRIYQETVQLTRESPKIARRLAMRWGPVVEEKVTGMLGSTVEVAELTSETPVVPKATVGGKRPALTIVESEEGVLGVHIGSGVDIIQEGPKQWTIRPHDAGPAGFRVAQLLSDGVERTFEYLKGNALELLRVGQLIVSRVSRGVFLFFMTLMVAGYLMHTRDDVVQFFRSLVPPASRRSFDRLMHRMDRGLSGVVRGQLIICALNGLLSAVGFAMFGLQYWPILALLAGVLSIIPIFGSILSTVPAVLIGLTQDLWTALWVLVWIFGIHQIEANILNPKIIGVAARLHPVLVVFVLVVGEHFFGLWGALLAVPVLSLAQSLFNHFRLETMPDVTPDSVALSTPPPSL